MIRHPRTHPYDRIQGQGLSQFSISRMTIWSMWSLSRGNLIPVNPRKTRIVMKLRLAVCKFLVESGSPSVQPGILDFNFDLYIPWDAFLCQHSADSLHHREASRLACSHLQFFFLGIQGLLLSLHSVFQETMCIIHRFDKTLAYTVLGLVTEPLVLPPHREMSPAYLG